MGVGELAEPVEEDVGGDGVGGVPGGLHAGDPARFGGVVAGAGAGVDHDIEGEAVGDDAVGGHGVEEVLGVGEVGGAGGVGAEERVEALGGDFEVVFVHALHGAADADPVAGPGLPGEEEDEGVGVVGEAAGHHLLRVRPRQAVPAVLQRHLDHDVVDGRVQPQVGGLHPLHYPPHLAEVARGLLHAGQQYRERAVRDRPPALQQDPQQALRLVQPLRRDEVPQQDVHRRVVRLDSALIALERLDQLLRAPVPQVRLQQQVQAPRINQPPIELHQRSKDLRRAQGPLAPVERPHQRLRRPPHLPRIRTALRRAEPLLQRLVQAPLVYQAVALRMPVLRGRRGARLARQEPFLLLVHDPPGPALRLCPRPLIWRWRRGLPAEPLYGGLRVETPVESGWESGAIGRYAGGTVLVGPGEQELA